MDRKLYEDIIGILMDKFRSDRLIICRGEGETGALRAFLSGGRQSFDEFIEKKDEKADVDEIVRNCARCGPGLDKTFGRGTGKNGVMLIMNMPSMVAGIEKKYLGPESDGLLQKIVRAAELDIADCYVTSLIKCEKGDPSLRPSQLYKNCEYILKKEIEYYSPKIILVFGDIIPLQKIIKDSVDIHWFNIDHPITLLKNPELKKRAWGTLKLAMEKYGEMKSSGVIR
ncbi:MAG: hypothetical protein MUD12_05185 [Spirochaetes bacterium]|jgi:uracil-DNA glycosylase family 4|nr:hypothetical protein [Spirochaetota bacterium]